MNQKMPMVNSLAPTSACPEEPPWLFSGSTGSLVLAFFTPRAPLGLAFKTICELSNFRHPTFQYVGPCPVRPARRPKTHGVPPWPAAHCRMRRPVLEFVAADQ